MQRRTLNSNMRNWSHPYMSTAGQASSSSLLEGRNLLKLWRESGKVGEPTKDEEDPGPLIADPPKDRERKSERPEPPPVFPPSFPSKNPSSIPSRSDRPKSDLAGELGGLPPPMK